MNTTPFDVLPPVPSFSLRSDSVTDGQAWAIPQLSTYSPLGGRDLSPHLAWSGAPDGTRSYVVTVYDADAPTGSGLWHWAVRNIPATTLELPEGAGSKSGVLPAGAVAVHNDARSLHYLGAAPPAGTGRHTYFVAVHALDVDGIDLPEGSTPAYLGFLMFGHVIGRGVLTATAETTSV